MLTDSSCDPSPPPASYLGCYQESSNPPATLLGNSFSDNTVDTCIFDCAQRGFPYSGAKSTSCYCWSTRPHQRRPEPECSTSCPGDAELKCGGSSRMSVHQSENVEGTLVRVTGVERGTSAN